MGLTMLDDIDIDDVDDQGCSPLHVALLKGGQYILSCSVPLINKSCWQQQTAHRKGAGHVEVVALLLAKGASVRLACEGSPPLHLAICSAAHRCRAEAAAANVQLLLEQGCQAVQRWPSPLFGPSITRHASSRHTTHVRNAELAVACRDDNGQTALHWAASLGQTRLLPILLQHAEAQAKQEAARIQATSAQTGAAAPEPPVLPSLHVMQVREWQLPLSQLHMQSDARIVAAAIAQGLALGGAMQDKQGNTALHLAADSRQAEACAYLLSSAEGAAAALVTNKMRQHALHVAAASGLTIVVQQLLAANPEAAQHTDNFGRKPLDWAIMRQHPVGHSSSSCKAAGWAHAQRKP